MRSAASHLALYAALYVASASVMLAQLSGQNWRRWQFAVAILAAFFNAAGVYLIDRLKLRDAWIDPADLESQPDRYAFLMRRSARYRTLAYAMFALAAVAGFAVHPLAPVVVALSFVGIVIYAPWPRKQVARVKDRLWLKNLYVAVGITGMGAIVALVSTQASLNAGDPHSFVVTHPARFAIAALLVCGYVYVDAALCDIDDESADRHFRTDTFSTRWGGSHVYRAGMTARLIASAVVPMLTVLDLRARLAWSIATLAATLVLIATRSPSLRDRVDSVFPYEAAAVTVALLAAGYF
jgi:hypothetical protein